jgi:Fe-S oxidoreductase
MQTKPAGDRVRVMEWPLLRLYRRNKPERTAMIGYMESNRNGNGGFTDKSRGRAIASVKTCPVCLACVDICAARLPDGQLVTDLAQWQKEVCRSIKDGSVNGGYQAGCAANAFPPF